MSLFYKVIQSHIKDFESNLYTSMPAVVEEYQPQEQTVTVQPSINVVDVDGVVRQFPIMKRVPLLLPSVSDMAITFPIKKGDKVVLHFCQSNMDNFFTQAKGEFQSTTTPNTRRNHSVNDCFVSLGFRTYDDTCVKREGTFDLYYKDTRITMSEDGKLELELVKTDGDTENPQVQHTQKIEMNPSGDTKINFIKDDIDSEINVLNTGEINAKNNKESSSLTLKADGNISGVTKSKFSIENDTVELVTALSDLAQLLIDATTNTYYGAMPLNNKAAIQALKNKIDSLKV